MRLQNLKLALLGVACLKSDMAKKKIAGASIEEISKQVAQLRRVLASFEPSVENPVSESSIVRKFVNESGLLLSELREFREAVSPVYFGAIGISLGRSDGIAKFFAFSFVNQQRRLLGELSDAPFYGSGVYAIYYVGKCEGVYNPLSGTETPIYVGKSTPANANAETVEDQGQALYKRLQEHAKNIRKTQLDLADFEYRAAPIQTGMQGAVEDFMIRLFKPIWNKEIKICFGIGKHGDSASTRRNKRSPWDTMHPGRSWAKETSEDQMSRLEIESKIEAHFKSHPIFTDKDKLFKHLALE
jgi:hypothetical protein